MKLKSFPNLLVVFNIILFWLNHSVSKFELIPYLEIKEQIVVLVVYLLLLFSGKIRGLAKIWDVFYSIVVFLVIWSLTEIVFFLVLYFGQVDISTLLQYILFIFVLLRTQMLYFAVNICIMFFISRIRQQ